MKSKSFLTSIVALAIVPFSICAAAELEGNLDKTFTASPGGRLILQADRGSVDVATDANNQVHVLVLRRVKGGTKSQGENVLAQHEVTFQQDGRTVTVTAKNKQKLSWGFNRPNLEVRYKVNIPKTFNLELSTAGGDIQVGDLDGAA